MVEIPPDAALSHQIRDLLHPTGYPVFEKLLREGLPGLWFHTLEKASLKDWATLYERTLEAFKPRTPDPELAPGTEDHKDLSVAIKAATHSIHFVFCVLNGGGIERDFVIDFSKESPNDWEQQLKDGFQL